MLYTLNTSVWTDPFSAEEHEKAMEALEKGQVLYFPSLPFNVRQEEKRLLAPSVLKGKSKNVSFDPRKNELKRTACSGEKALLLKNMMSRFADRSTLLLETLLPQYRDALIQGRTSYRPVEVEKRASSLVKDDTRLHVDAFPATPNGGKRILRVFTNINPYNQSRHWNLGEPFEEMVRYFLPTLRSPVLGTRKLLSLLKLTKSYRSLYDHYMLALHDQMKLDNAYQTKVKKTSVHFPPGTTWAVMTDCVSHAALRGQFILEQTFHLPVSAMQDPKQSPLFVLERVLEKSLIEPVA